MGTPGTLKIIAIDSKDLPLIVVLTTRSNEKKEYILKITSSGDKIFLNKKEY